MGSANGNQDTEPHLTPPTPDCAEGKTGAFSRLRSRVRCYFRDVDAVLAHDPAARSRLEVIATYPGLHALWMHRLSHALWKRDRTFTARLLSHFNRFVTGVEIHPGAQFGQGVFIDHGMGVVVGETAQVGDGSILYKGVVLGGTSTERKQRHPRIGKRVVVGTNACILGDILVGDGARIGSGSVVVRDVPNHSTVVGVPGRIVPPKGDRRARFDATLDHSNLPDPIAETIRVLRDENDALRSRIERLEQKLAVEPPQEEHSPHLIDSELATADLPPQHGG